MSLDAIEPQVEERLRHRKRPASSNDTMSDTASTTSSRLHSSLASSPLTAPMFSDDHTRSGGSYVPNKRVKPLDLHKMPSTGQLNGRRTRVPTGRNVSWKKSRGLPESSPIRQEKHARFPSHNMTSLSFISEGSTVPDDPPSPEFSEEDDADLPVHSFSVNASARITTSPPHTPPPPDRRMRKAHNVAWSRTPKNGEGDADLLLYLATSPSPATKTGAKTVVQAPKTPPCKSTPLPSSHMTPGMNGSNYLGFGPNTPSTNFNFADFVNVTPSPAQGAFTRTPVAGRTPATGARRRLNFDNLVPPTSNSPELRRTRSDNALGMELGGELVSSQ